MKERPILFSAPMVRALLAGTKTQTRRVAKGVVAVHTRTGEALANIDSAGPRVICPYGQPGDRLWVREAWAPRTLGAWPIMDQHTKPLYRASEDRPEWKRIWKPSIHMPRWASRITLEVTGVRVERLQNISKADAIAEGIEEGIPASGTDVRVWKNYSPNKKDTPWLVCPLNSYFSLWQSINGPGSWDVNPWVWAVEFKRLNST